MKKVTWLPAIVAAVFFAAGIQEAGAETIQGQVIEINPNNQTLQLRPTSREFRHERRIQLTVGDETHYGGHLNTLEDIRVGEEITVEARAAGFQNWQAEAINPAGEAAGEGSTYRSLTEHGTGKYSLDTARRTSLDYGKSGIETPPRSQGEVVAR